MRSGFMTGKKLFVNILIFLLTGFAAVAQDGQARYAVIPKSPRLGEPVTVAVSHNAGAKSAALIQGGKQIAKAAFFTVPAEGGKPAFLAAVLTVPAGARPGEAVITVETAA
ncbi:MAG: hypothetical protein FWC24_02125, partial [Treponema sp.]|nr:hypothetical protein [Treponema sp.]